MGNPRPKETETPKPSPGEKYPLAERQRMQLEMHAMHVDVDELRSSDGLFAVISQRRSNGCFTFAVWRAFQRAGEENEDRTSFIPAELGQSYVTLVQLALERIEAIRKAGTAPFKERGRP